MAPPAASVLKKAREAAARLKEKKMKLESMVKEEEEEDLGDMCGPMRPPPGPSVGLTEEYDLDEEEAGPTMPPPMATTTTKKKGRWGADSSDDEAEEGVEEEEEEEEEATATNDNKNNNNKQKESYLEKMMNEQAEFANFTAQQMQTEEGEDGSVREDDVKHARKRNKREVVDVAKLLTPPSDDSDNDDDDNKNSIDRKRAENGRRQQPRMDPTPEMEDLEDGHKTMDTPPMGEEVEDDDGREARPMLPPGSMREQIVNANRGMVEERRALLDGAVANNKNNNNEFSESEEDEEDGKKVEYVPLLPKPHDHKKACRSVECFEKLGHIDEGTYGVVFKARDKETGEIAALKKVKMDKEREGFPVTALREINTLLQLQHKNIVYVSEVVVGRSIDQVFMVMEYCGRDLNRMMDDMNRGFTLPECKCLAWQLLSGVSYLHENWVLHRDLKTTNVLFNDLGELKICDFGLAREYGSPLNNYTPLVCTLWYRPPELLLGEKKYSYAVDNWSLGCIFAELLQGKPLFPGRTEIDQIDKHFRMLGTPNEQIWPKFKSLPHATKVNFAVHPHNSLRQRFPKHREHEDEIEIGPGISDAGFDILNGLLVFDPERRLSATEALKSRWFSEEPRKNSSREWQELLRRLK